MIAAKLEYRPGILTGSRPVELRAEHLPQALELSRALKWPYRLEDWAFAHRLGHGFAIETDGRLVGTALWWPYGDRYATAGMIIVAAQAQRKGFGRALMDALLADASGRTIMLNSTEEGLALYKRISFAARGHVHQHQAVLPKVPANDGLELIRAFEHADRAAIHDLDRAASGMDREALIDSLLAIADTKVVERGGQISGYGCVREWGHGLVIGPVVAADDQDARTLIVALAALHVGSFVRINLPAAAGLSPWLECIGLPLVDSEVAMALGNVPQTSLGATLFALCNPSLG